MARLQSVTLRDPTDKDQTGARVWTRSSPWAGPGNPLPTEPGCNLAVAWGQDPRNASISTPGLDAGTSVPPLRLQEGSKSLVLTPEGDADQDGQLSPGDTARYILTVKNISSVVIPGVYVYDVAPANTTYVPNTTYWSADGSTWTKIPSSDDGGVLPLSVAGGYPLGDLAPGATWTIRFDVTLDSDSDYEELYNCDVVYSGAGAFTRCVTSFVASRDWGDLPDSYGTSRAANGPRHSRSGPLLGAAYDYEAQGQPSPAADGDDLTLVPDDEDGVTLIEWEAGALTFSVVVAGGDGCLNAWMDFTDDAGSGPGAAYADGDFTRPDGYDRVTVGETTYSEHIIQNVAVVAGTNTLVVTAPPSLDVAGHNLYYLRFRLSPGPCTTPIAPTGLVIGGEVEDYQLDIVSKPTAVRLLWFEVTGMEGQAITLGWETASEFDTVGFNLYRATSIDGQRTKVNAELIPTLLPPGSVEGAVYDYADTLPEQDKDQQVIYYWLEQVDIYGATELYGPLECQR